MSILTEYAPMPPRSMPTPPRRALRVLFALSGMHRVVRGAEVALEEVARRLAQQSQFEVTVIGSGRPREAEPYRFRQASCIRRERFEKWPSLPGLRDHYGYEELTFVPGLMRAYRPSDFDVTVTCGYPYTNWVLRGMGGRRGPKHVFVTQNGDWMVQSKTWEYRHFGCDGLVCTNPEYFDRHQHRWPSALIPNGVDPALFYPGPATRGQLGLPADATVVLIVSALAPFKRVLDGVRATARVPNAFLVIAGDGEQRRDVQQLGDSLMPGRFRLLTLPRQQMPNLYRSADVFLHMSQDEPSANAYIEALSTGLPIVTHDRAVTRWTLERHALLVDTSDHAAVSSAIEQATQRRSAADIEGRRRMAAERFGWAGIARRYGEFFEQVAAFPCQA
jgi:glycosyltransferase involved in cell wall biosynthesis